jgi:hypothetical protein
VNTVISTFTLESIDPINPAIGLKMKDEKSSIVFTGAANLR